jgi:transcriptional regulator of acetoin/glycerol metabolism
VLAEHRGDINEAARVLGMDRTGLYKAMERLGIKAVQQ